MREKAVQFGKTASLVGVLTEPLPGAALAGAPAVVWLDSGILHRVGACRLYVRIARRLAEHGIASLRFDFSGLGDSEQRRDTLRFEESAIVETREAMDWLAQTRGTREFVLAGLCSGADMAHETARIDERVVGLGMLDGWAYRTRRAVLLHYARRMLDPSAWAARARIMLGGSRPGSETLASQEGADFEIPKYVREYPPHERVREDLARFMGRGLRMLQVFSGGQDYLYNYRDQYADSFRGVAFGDQLQVEYLADADHIFTGLEHQKAVIAMFERWALEVATARGARPATPAVATPGRPGAPPEPASVAATRT
jgi:hypothetical protein